MVTTQDKINQKAQKWLDDNFKKDAKEIDLAGLKLKGVGKQEKPIKLKIDGYPNLTTIKKSDENDYKINDLTITNCPKLTSLKLKNPKELKNLNINPTSAFTNLDFLKGFDELTLLNVSNNPELSGSLEPLKNMTNLKTLDIGGTNINSGLKYLPEKLETFFCRDRRQGVAKTKANELVERLKDYGKNKKKPATDGFYDLAAWREANKGLYPPVNSFDPQALKDNTIVELTIKGVAKKEEEGKCQVEIEEKITGTNENFLVFYKSIDTPLLGKSGQFIAHSGADSFYYFIHNLGKDTAIPIRRRQRHQCISLSDGSIHEGTPTPVLDIIKEEKAKWRDLDYTAPEDLLQENKYLVDLGFKKGEEKYNLYEELKKIANEFARDRLEGKTIQIIPTGKQDGTNAYTNWKSKGKDKSGFEIYIDISSKEKTEVFRTLAHEMAHSVVDLKVWNDEQQKSAGKSKLYSSQSHSKTFWEVFLDEDNISIPKKVSTLEFVKSKLTKEEQDRLGEFIKIEKANKVARWVYFPEVVNSKEKLVGKVRRKKVLKTSDQGKAKEEWDKIRKIVLKSANDSMNNSPVEGVVEERWKDHWNQNSQKWEMIEKDKRWVQVEVWKKDEVEEVSDQGKYKIYVYCNNNVDDVAKDLIKELDNKLINDKKGNWEKTGENHWELIDLPKAEKLHNRKFPTVDKKNVNKSQALMKELNVRASANQNSKGSSPLPYVVGGSALVASVGIVGYFLLKKNKKINNHL